MYLLLLPTMEEFDWYFALCYGCMKASADKKKLLKCYKHSRSLW
jgi:hypothetical protein